jgi:tRNA-Thr(GGU) m(6)t(6)A37 methyltransferase TsaA
MNLKSNYVLHAIGSVQSELKNLDDCPLQESEGAPEATLQIADEFRNALDGLLTGDKLILFTWFHLADRTILNCRMRRETDTPMRGVFTTRSPDRPNPIGLHRVTILEIMGNGDLRVSPLEALDGTPIIDIKPDLG